MPDDPKITIDLTREDATYLLRTLIQALNQYDENWIEVGVDKRDAEHLVVAEEIARKLAVVVG